MSCPPKSCGARMHTSDVPPSRKSILALGDVKPVGPHHFIICSASLHACQTCSTGASKTRVTVSVRGRISLLIEMSPHSGQPDIFLSTLESYSHNQSKSCIEWQSFTQGTQK